MSGKAQPRGRRGHRLRRTLRFGEHVLAALGALFIIFHVFFELSQVVSPSMSPTLQGTGGDDGDWVLSERLTYCLRKPRRWEVVAFRNDEGLDVMKRVMGLPGETVALKDNVLLVGGAPVPRPTALQSVKYYASGKLRAAKEADCGEGYFVLGDDSRDSWDSRYTGSVEPERISARAWLIVWPLSRFGFVNP